MHNEIKKLCAEQNWRGAIDFVARIPPGPRSGKTEGLIHIGNQLLDNLPEDNGRDTLLVEVVEGLLQLGDTEHTGRFVLGLSDRQIQERFGEVIGAAMRRRQDDTTCEGK